MLKEEEKGLLGIETVSHHQVKDVVSKLFFSIFRLTGRGLVLRGVKLIACLLNSHDSFEFYLL